MKKILTISLIILITNLTLGRVHIILFDCSGSFIGQNVPDALKNGSLKKISELINNMAPNDTLIFFSIRENSSLSSLNQVVLVKEKAKTVFDPTLNGRNNKLIQKFAKNVLSEINKPPAERTDLISAVNFASATARNYTEASIYIFSDGADNVKAKLFKRLDDISIYHLFIFDKSPDKQNGLLQKWQKIYKDLGAKTINVLDAQASFSFKIGNK